MSEPEPTERPAEAIQREFDVPVTPVGTWHPVHQQARASQGQAGSQQVKQEAIGQRHEQEQFATRLPITQPQGFDEQFGFLKAEVFLDFPA